MAFNASQLLELSTLVDVLQALPLEDRAARLATLTAEQAVFRPVLAQLLVQEAQVETADFLSTLPKLNESVRAQPSDLAAGADVGPYRLIREIGHGGMGTVWLAERSDGVLRRPVALKLPHSVLPQRQLAERFARERDILAALTHPNIARLYDAGVTAQGQPYLALEYVEGEQVLAWCDHRQLGLRERITLFQQVLAAVQYAHGQLVVHRDLKPSNILVTQAGEVRLLDFGIAKLLTDGQAVETELTQLGGRALTLQYASPEQITGQAIGTASDVYTLGVVLYELLTGVLPYRVKRDSRGAMEDAVLTAEPIKPSQGDIDAVKASARTSTCRQLARQLAGDLDTILLKALKKNAADRYGTVDALAQDLARYQKGEAVLARPDSAWYRGGKFLRRNWIASSAAAAVLLSLATGLGVALWQANVASQQAQTATAVQNFMRDIFQANSSNQADPQKARLTTARELLDLGAGRVDHQLNDVPKAKSEVLRTLGDLYMDIGEQEKAVAIHRKRIGLVRTAWGGESLELADAAVALCHVLEQDFSPSVMAERKALLDQAQRILDKRGDNGSELRARLFYQQGFLLQASDMGQAYDDMARAIKIYRSLPPSAAAIETIADAAQMLYGSARFDQAKSLLEEALRLAKSVGNDANAVLPQIHTTLGNVLFALGDRRAAVAAHRTAFETASALNGSHHESFYMSGSAYGNMLMRNSQPKLGVEVLRQAFEAAVTARGEDDRMFVQNVAYEYGTALGDVGQVEAGLKLVTRAIEHLPGPREHRTFLRWIESQAKLLTMLGRYQEAVALFDETRHSREKNAGAVKPDLSEYFAERLPLALATGQAKQALAELRQLPQFQSAKPGINGLLLLAKAELAAADLAPAQQHASAALVKIGASPWPELSRSKEAQAEKIIGSALLTEGHAALASSHLARAIEVEKELVDIGRSPELADLYVLRGQCDLALGRRREARAWLDAAQAIHGIKPQLGVHLLRPVQALAAALGAG